ncbi:hypothetical protein LIER_35877 [Lithospermum erythrorhizon]|uniref:Reverse transcriptase Ty1/copia-type domain-containing protein n=1 Tax=Lithospermum erythrorhizon TaxID=34254 RepID=A0AAV3NXI3_LITER
MLILGNTLDVINKNKELLSSNFDMKDLGEAGVILGVRVIRNFEGIFLSQSHYVEMVLKKFNSFDVALARTPYNPSLHLTKDLDESISQNEYAKIIGTIDVCLYYGKFPAVLEGYCDANWISGNDEISSTNGYVFTMGGGATLWKSTKQTCIACSTMESEFIALELAGQEGDWLRNLLTDVPV